MNTNAEQQQLEQSQALNRLLLEMNKNQKDSNTMLTRTFIATIVCYTILLVSMIVGFFWCEGQSKITEQDAKEKTVQEVFNTDSEISDVKNNLY